MHRRTFVARAVSAAAALGFGVELPARLWAQEGSTPEAHGVSSDIVRQFLKAVAGSSHEIHSCVLRRHGQTVAQGWWAPYRAHAVHSLYSLSKSFTSTAVGLAIAEGRLELTDRVIDFFPQQRPADPGDYLAALRVRDLLTMSVGHKSDSAPILTRQEDWVQAFLSMPIEHAPGSVFLYDSGASYMLSAIVQRVSGKPVIEYLRPRLFEPLEIRDARWSVCPRGINTGGWGLSLSSESIAKFGQLYLQQGRWKGRELLPPSWVREATSFQIQPPPGAGNTRPDADLAQLKQTSDWHQGYGYQFWRCRHGAYRGDGAFGQYCIVLPEQDAVIAITSLTADSQGLLNLVWDQLLPAVQDRPLAPNPASADLLSHELAALTLPLPQGAADSPHRARISGRRFQLDDNRLGARSLALQFANGSCRFELQTDQPHAVICGIGTWIDGATSMPGTPPEFTELTGRSSVAPLPNKVAAAAAWKDERTLHMRWRFYETPHYDTVTCRLDGDRVRVEFVNNITAMSGGAHAEPRPVLEGRLTAT